MDIFAHSSPFSLVASPNMDFVQIISWVLQAAGLFGLASMYISDILFKLWARIKPGPAPQPWARNLVAAAVPFTVVTAIYVAAVFTGNDVWGWANYFDFAQVGFAAATGQALARVLTGQVPNYITLDDLILWAKANNPQLVIAAIEQALADLLNPPQLPPPPAPAP